MNPLDQKGIPVDEQLRSWSELNVEPYDKREVDPYTRTRVIDLPGRPRWCATGLMPKTPAVSSRSRLKTIFPFSVRPDR